MTFCFVEATGDADAKEDRYSASKDSEESIKLE